MRPEEEYSRTHPSERETRILAKDTARKIGKAPEKEGREEKERERERERAAERKADKNEQIKK